MSRKISPKFSVVAEGDGNVVVLADFSFTKNQLGSRLIKITPFPGHGGVYSDATAARMISDERVIVEADRKDILSAGIGDSINEISYPEDGAVHWKFPAHGIYRSPSGLKPFPKLIPLSGISAPFCFAQGHVSNLAIVEWTGGQLLPKERLVLSFSGAQFLFHFFLLSNGNEPALLAGTATREIGDGIVLGVLLAPSTPGKFWNSTPVGKFPQHASMVVCPNPLFLE